MRSCEPDSSIMTISIWAWLPLLAGLLLWLSRVGRRPLPRPVGWNPSTVEDRITVEENGVVYPGKDDLEWQISHLERTIHENDRELQRLLDTLKQEYPTDAHAKPSSADRSPPPRGSGAVEESISRPASGSTEKHPTEPVMSPETSAPRDLVPTRPLPRVPSTHRKSEKRPSAFRSRLLQLIRHRSSAALLPLLKGVTSGAEKIRRWCSRGLLRFPADLLSQRIPALFETGKIRPSNRFYPIVRKIPDPSQLRMMEHFLGSNRHRIRRMGIAFALKLGRIELNDSLITAIQIQDQELLGRAQRAIEFEARLGSDPQELHRWIARIRRLPPQQAVSRLARLAHHSQPFVRAAVVRALGECDHPDVFPLLETAAKKDHEFEVRLAGIAGLGRFGLRGQDTLLAALGDHSSEVVLTTIKTLTDIRCTDALPHLEPLTRSEHPTIRFFAAHAIGQIRSTF